MKRYVTYIIFLMLIMLLLGCSDGKKDTLPVSQANVSDITDDGAQAGTDDPIDAGAGEGAVIDDSSADGNIVQDNVSIDGHAADGIDKNKSDQGIGEDSVAIDDTVDGIDPKDIDYEKLCTTKIPSDAKHVDASFGSSHIERYELPDGTFVGPYWKWYDDDKKQRLSFRCYDKDGRKNGPAVDWEKDGNLETSYGYKEDRFDGYYREYDDGILVEEQYYDEGIKTGTWKSWNKESVLQKVENYKDGEKHGIWQIYYDNGNLKEEQVYDMGVKTASYKSFYEDGSPQIERSGTTELARLTGISIAWSKPDSDGHQTGTKCNVVDGVNKDCEKVSR